MRKNLFNFKLKIYQPNQKTSSGFLRKKLFTQFKIIQ